MRRIAGILLFVATSLSAQTIAFRRVPVPDDVPAHLCTAIAQDRSGLLWFGTQGGLVRYDGYEFRVFRSNPADANTIAGNYVRALLVASDGRLWVGTFSGGLSVFDPQSETFTRFELAYDRVEGLAEDAQHRIWIATTAGLDRLDPRTKRVEHVRHDVVRGLLVDRHGTLWVGTRDGLLRRDAHGFTRVAMAGHYVMRLFEDSGGRIWIGTEDAGAAVLDPSSGALTMFAPGANGLSHYWVYGFAEAVPGEIWIATFGGGIDVVDAKSMRIVERLRNDPVLDDTIGADRVGAIFRDRSGLVWVGTWGEGVARHDPRTRAFRSMRFSPNRANGLTHAAAVRAMEMRDGRIWVGTNGNGIDVFDRELRRVDHVALGDGAVTCLAQGEDGAIWIATLDGSLLRGKDKVQGLPGGPIRTMAFSGDGTMWAGAAEGMVRVDPKTLATRVYRRWPGAAKASPAIESIVVARDGKLWVGTDNGLYWFDPRTESAIRIAKENGLPDNWVPDLMLARDGTLWIGTARGACVLTHWDGHTARFRAITTQPAEALIEDDEGAVWIGPRLRVDAARVPSPAGSVRHGGPAVHPTTANGGPSQVREFGPADGVAFRNFFIASRAKTRDGRVLFGSPQGLLVVDPRAIPEPHEFAPVVATALRVEGKAMPGAAVLPALALSASQRSFTLDFAALDFAAVTRQAYRYRLVGLDQAWTIAGPAQHSLTYSRLPPGSYTLRVGVTNRDGSWSARELRLPVTVLPAFHQTKWFRALMALLAAALIYGVYRLRVRQLRERERELEHLVALRTSELATAYEQIQEASLTDPLTGLRNRRYLEQTIGADLEIAARDPERDLVILMLDLDHFKSVNDQHGHAAGDAVLAELAQILLRTFRTSDTVVRWGGEEFLIVVRFVDRAHAAELAEKLRATVAAHPFLLADGTALRRTCSIGFAAWPFSRAHSRALGFERVVDLADAALYIAKHGGRNAWVGVSAGEGHDPAEVAEAFRQDPEKTAARGAVVIERSKETAVA